MVIAAIILISALLMALFVWVTVAGGKALDRKEAEEARKAARRMVNDDLDPSHQPAQDH